MSAGHASGALAATEHLLSLGHRRIGAITGPRGWLATSERLNGYHGALAAAGVMPDPEWSVGFQTEPGARRPPGCSTCRPADGDLRLQRQHRDRVLRAARKRGLRVPEDLSVVGFDDSEHAAIVTPPLTTVRQPLAEMGRMAVMLLTRLLEGQRLEALHIELKTRLVLRGSTARAARPEPQPRPR